MTSSPFPSPWMIRCGLVWWLCRGGWWSLLVDRRSTLNQLAPRQFASSVDQSDCPVEKFVDFNRFLGQGKILVSLIQLKEAIAPRHCPIVLNHPFFSITLDVAQLHVTTRFSVNIDRRPCFHVELVIQRVQELPLQKRVG
jgi:hypothetical protein